MNGEAIPENGDLILGAGIAGAGLRRGQQRKTPRSRAKSKTDKDCPETAGGEAGQVIPASGGGRKPGGIGARGFQGEENPHDLLFLDLTGLCDRVAAVAAEVNGLENEKPGYDCDFDG
ncbi:MAG: hypothetical protein ACM3QZ_07775 [Solirubrobacterales bacterium]